ncbi:Fucose permease [Sphingobacterium nematocida]|uniref:Fucose permease n=1 Tax=Sphingobacterium nematocida TaxID=1513896 RepID=A0A1T5G7Y9_9SPHI|nr:MFS transporter [Sphingobacterium nematocida]SKC04441.1 Fucose permease [Sphingobacterium nematocida]
MSTIVLGSTDNLSASKRRIRIAVSLFYFCQGIAFASWASRIPIIKAQLQLTEAQLGTILLMLPIGQLVTMALSGRLVSRYGSHRILPITAIVYGMILCGIAFATDAWQLGACLFLFGVIGNMCNISVNTQGVLAESLYNKPIMASFHGVWSLAGFAGALLGLLTLNISLSTLPHFIIIFFLIVVNVLVNRRHLAPPNEQNIERTSSSFKPDKILISLGIVGFCSMATEGAMFDWSGVYFQDIVLAPESLIMLGYASFMIMMATGRFIGDKIIQKIGRQRTLQFSGVLMSLGMMLSVAFPSIFCSTIGFMLVGLGVSCNVPTVYSIAGKHTKIPSGVALAMVSSISYLGFLMGPPLIGYIAELFSLRYSYAVFSLFGLLLLAMTSYLKVFREN